MATTQTVRPTAAQRLKAAIASQPTPTLVDVLQGVDNDNAWGAPEGIVRVAVINELERRYPSASDAVDAAFLAADTTGETVDYVATLIAVIPNT